jgi:hypothetical protein
MGENFTAFFEDYPIHDLYGPVLCLLCSEHGTWQGFDTLRVSEKGLRTI